LEACDCNAPLQQESSAASEHAKVLMTQIMKGKKLPWGKARFELLQQQQHSEQGNHHEEQQQQQQLHLQPHPPSDSRSSSLAPRHVTLPQYQLTHCLSLTPC
jgi:hypothetical protein